MAFNEMDAEKFIATTWGVKDLTTVAHELAEGDVTVDDLVSLVLKFRGDVIKDVLLKATETLDTDSYIRFYEVVED